MKAAILMESNKPLVVANIELPRDLLHGQVLVKVVYSGICGAQINEIEAAKGPDKFLPHLLGHEGSGMVLDVGPGVTSVKQGDHVVMHWRPSQGIQSETPKYSLEGNRVNAGWVTTFNEFAVLSENRLTVIPKDFDLKLGVGGVGLNIAQAADMVSAYPIVGIDLIQSKLEMAKMFGVSHAFVGSDDLESCVETIREVVGQHGADVVVDTTGIARVIESAYELTHPDGKTILVGVPRKGDNISINTLPLHFNKILKGSHGGDSKPHIDIPNYIKLLSTKKIDLNSLITHEYSLANINDAVSTLKGGQAGRIIIKMD